MVNTIKRILCGLLCFTLLLSLFPASSLAANNVITGFEKITGAYYFYQDQTLDEIKNTLPKTINVFLNEDTEATEINVSWDCVEDFENTNLFEYNFIPNWGSNYELSSKLNDSFDIPILNVINGDVGQGKSLAASNESTAYSYAKDKIGLNTAASCGILQNLYSESGIIPNNLENYYNVKLGYTDAGYTKAVNEKTYSESKFVKDSAGYGICQWTYYTRKQKLYDRTVKKGYSVANLSRQLELLSAELSGYTAVWHTLKSVPNTDIGAFLSATTMCMGFENPAQDVYKTTSRTRGINAVKNYWSEYGGKYDTNKSYLGLAGYNYPTNIKKSSGITVTGYVASNYKLSSVKAKIYNSDNKALYTASASPSTYIYNLKNFDNKMAFSKLAAGTYKYCIYAKDSSGKTITAYKSFKVNSSSTAQSYTTSTANVGESFTPANTEKTDSKIIKNGRYPSKLYYKGLFTIKGTVSSDEKLTNVTVSITDANNKVLQSKSINPNAKTFDVYKLDDNIKFGTLPSGTYYYKISATDKVGTKTLVKKKFTVSKYSLSSYNYPVKIKKGRNFIIKGTVKSKFNLTQVSVNVYNSKGKKVTYKVKTLSGVKSYNVYKLRSYLKFKKLARGKYTYTIIANDGLIKKTVLSKKFKVI